MSKQTLGLRVASVVFGLIGIAQLARLAMRVEVTVTGRVFPLWPSGVAAVVALGLCAWMWSLSRGAR